MRRGRAFAVLALLVVAWATAVSGWSAGHRAEPQLFAVTYADGELRVQDTNGHTLARLVGTGPGALDPVWSPDGRRIAFVRHVGKRHARFAVFVVDAAGGGLRRLTRGFGGIDTLTWSPDGTSIAFLGRKGRYGEAVFELRGRRLTELTQMRVGMEPQGLAWLPHGTLVTCCASRGPWLSPTGALQVVVRGDSRGNPQLVLEDRSGRRVWLTRDRPVDREVRFNVCCAAWSPDGSKVVFSSNLTAKTTTDLFVVDTHSGRERRLTWGRDVFQPVSVSGDGSLAAFGEDRSGVNAVSLKTGRIRQLAVEGMTGFAWRPVPGLRVAEPKLASLEHLPVHRVSMDWRWYGVPQPGRLRDVRVIRRTDPYLEAMSPNGRLAAFTTYGRSSRTYSIVLLDLATGAERWLPGRDVVDEKSWEEGSELPIVGFSPHGRRLLARSGRTLIAVDVRSGRRRVVARGVPWGPTGWLRDGRVAFLDARRRLVVGGRVTRFRAPKLIYSDPSWSPDGSRVLYAKGCAVWMLDLRTGARRKIAASTRGDGFVAGFSPGPWSPNGRYFLLQTGSWAERCTYFDSMGSDWSIRLADGRRVGRFDVWGDAAWSADSRSLLGFPYITGTDVGKDDPLTLYSLRTGKAAMLLAGRLGGTAFLGRDGRLIYGRYLSTSDRDGREYLYTARLSPRWR